jgi:anaerobic magnesium-protoporphyrin IX monomethyl ester cyclase
VRVYLLTPASTAVLRSERYARLEPALMPMALAYLGAVLRQDGHQVALRDQAAVTWSSARVLEEIRRFEPDLVGISALTGAWAETVGLIRGLRQVLPGVPVVLGNTHATTFAHGILERGLAEFVVRGEGERSLSELAGVLASGGDPGSVRGVSWRDGDAVIHNPERAPITDLDELPWPAWDLLDLAAWRYQQIPMVNLRSHPVPLMASRGCSHACSFCSQDKVVRTFRQRSVSRVVDELDAHVKRYGFRCFGFNDSYFPWSEEAGIEFADRLRCLPWQGDTRWVTETRVDQVNDRVMGAMARAGLHAVFYGLESGDEAVLAGLGKGTSLAQGREAVRIAHSHGVLVIGFFMLGLPGDTPESMARTVRYAADIGVDIAKFAVTVPYPGSPLFGALGRDWLEPEECAAFTSWADWWGETAWAPPSPSGMPTGEITRWQRRAMLQFYARPSFLLRSMRRGLFTPGEMLLGGRLLLSRAAGREA